MKELSLNILDIAQNSVKAGATLVTITVDAQPAENCLTITVADNGCGMSEEFVRRVTDPFTTTRTTRKVGLGIPLFKLSAEQAGGDFSIRSKVGEGTVVTARYELGHIDRMPLGDIAGTISALVGADPAIDFVYEQRVGAESFVLDTREVRGILGDVPLDSPEVLLWIREYLSEQITNMKGAEQI